MFQGGLAPHAAKSCLWWLLKYHSWCGCFQLISWEYGQDLAWGGWVGRSNRSMGLLDSPKEVKMKAGLSLLFVDFGHEAAMRSCLQGTISKPRVNPSLLVGSPGMNSRTKLRRSGSATAFRKWASQSTCPGISESREILKVTSNFLFFLFLEDA